MKKIKITINPNECVVRNEMHFYVQRNVRAHTFTDRKKRDKSGYMKHKGAYV